MKASCEFAEYWISAKVDDVPLPADAATRLEEHLGSCAACRGLLDSERERATLLSSVLSPVGQQAALREMEAILLSQAMEGESDDEDRVPAKLPVLRRRGPLGLAAAAALVVGVGVWLLFTNQVEEETEPWQITLEEVRWDLDPVPGEDGKRLKREVRRVRNLRFDEETDPGVILDTERVDTRYIQFTDYR